MKLIFKKIKTIIIGPLVLIVLWYIVSQLKLIDPFFLPGPKETLLELIDLFAKNIITKDIIATLWRTVQSFLIAMILGIPLGLFLGKAEKIYRSLEFIIDFFRSLPATALFPLFFLIFGITDKSKIAVTAFACFLIILFHTAYGVMHSKKSRSLAAKIMGASKYQIFKWIVFWESLPQIFVGLRNSVSLALVIIVVTEMFIGTDVGLGRRIIDSQLIYEINTMYAAIFVTGVLGYLLNYLLLFFEKRFVHWSTQS